MRMVRWLGSFARIVGTRSDAIILYQLPMSSVLLTETFNEGRSLVLSFARITLKWKKNSYHSYINISWPTPEEPVL
jgi:hypothetical protein